MKVFLLADEATAEGPPWLNTLWPIYNAIERSIDTTFLARPRSDGNRSRLAGRFMHWNAVRQHGPVLRDQVLANLAPKQPNMLMVCAVTTSDVIWTTALFPIWSSFSHRVLHLFEQIHPENVPEAVINQFDCITCLCADLAAEYRRKFDIPVLFWPSHMDVLTFHSVSDYRPIDIILVGRRQDETFTPLHRHFNRIGAETVFLDFVTRTQTKIGGEDEFRVLFSAYAKSKCSYCIEPSYLAKFRGRSQLTGRWTHSMAAGCTVIGRAPTGTGVHEQLDWDEATIDLPADVDAAIARIEGLLADKDSLRIRRRRNVVQTLRRHDTRHRLRDLLEFLDVRLTDDLVDGLAQLDNAAHRLETDVTCATDERSS